MVSLHLWLIIPVGVVALISFVAALTLLAMVVEGDLVHRNRIYNHERSCYSNYWERLDKEHDRIRHLERELRRVPVAMRSRKTKKLIGERR